MEYEGEMTPPGLHGRRGRRTLAGQQQRKKRRVGGPYVRNLRSCWVGHAGLFALVPDPHQAKV